MPYFLRIPEGNVIRFIRTDNYVSTEPDYTNRLSQDLVLPQFYKRDTFMKFKISDVILIQVITNYTFTFKLYNYLTGAEVTSGFSPVTTTVYTYNDTTYGSVPVKNITIDTSALGGYYYFKFNFQTSTEIWQSEYFQIGNYESQNMVKVKYTSSGEFGVYNTGVETFYFRLEARFAKPNVGQEKVISKSYDGQINNLSGVASLYMMLELNTIPFWIFEKLNLASLHEYFYINDIEYQNEDKFSAENIAEGIDMTDLYSANILFRKKEYQKVVELENIAEPTDYPIFINSLNYKIYIDADNNFIAHDT